MCVCVRIRKLLLVKSCCYFVSLRQGCLLAGWWLVFQGLLVMCGYLELEGEEEKRRSNFTNGFAGASLFLLGIMVIGGVSEVRPLWLDLAALLILICSVTLVVNSAITFVRRGGNRTLYLMTALLAVVLYFDLVLLSYAAVMRDQERREREESARLSLPLTRRTICSSTGGDPVAVAPSDAELRRRDEGPGAQRAGGVCETVTAADEANRLQLHWGRPSSSSTY